VTHPATEAILRWLNYDHLPQGPLRDTSQLFYDLGTELVHYSGLSGPEVTVGLRKLVEAKDCFVRAAVEAQESA
jgi:hypothetical protein